MSVTSASHPCATAHRERLRGGSRSFFAASLLLPRQVAARATVLYAWCREADDAIDESPRPGAALESLRARLLAMQVPGRAAQGVDRDMAALMRECRIPDTLPRALLEGFAWDVEARTYHTLADVHAYGARVAGTVGVMMALLMDARAPVVLARAADLGVAMQLTNIARDVAEDARRGRLYLPADWMRDAGLDPVAWLRAPVGSAALDTVVARLLAHADTLYARAATGIGALPAACRPGMHAARRLYAGIGAELLRRGGDPFAGRAVVSPARKTVIVLQALADAVGAGEPCADPPLAATEHLVRSVADERSAAAEVARAREVGFGGACLGVFRMLERLEREARACR